MTQKALAERMMVSQSTVAMWETGKSKPRTAALLILASKLQATVTELLEDTSCENESAEALK